MIQNLITSKTPFAVMKYYVAMKGAAETNVAYEIMLHKIVNGKSAIITKKITDKDVKYLLSNLHLVNVNDFGYKGGGVIYEYLDFKDHFNVNSNTPVNPPLNHRN